MSLLNLVFLGLTVFEIFEELLSCRTNEHEKRIEAFENKCYMTTLDSCAENRKQLTTYCGNR